MGVFYAHGICACPSLLCERSDPLRTPAAACAASPLSAPLTQRACTQQPQPRPIHVPCRLHPCSLSVLLKLPGLGPAHLLASCCAGAVSLARLLCHRTPMRSEAWLRSRTGGRPASCSCVRCFALHCRVGLLFTTGCIAPFYLRNGGLHAAAVSCTHPCRAHRTVSPPVFLHLAQQEALPMSADCACPACRVLA